MAQLSWITWLSNREHLQKAKVGDILVARKEDKDQNWLLGRKGPKENPYSFYVIKSKTRYAAVVYKMKVFPIGHLEPILPLSPLLLDFTTGVIAGTNIRPRLFFEDGPKNILEAVSAYLEFERGVHTMVNNYEFHGIVEGATEAQMKLFLDAFLVSLDLAGLKGNAGYSTVEEAAYREDSEEDYYGPEN